jgi:uncharacterized protein (TIGR04255 family)
MRLASAGLIAWMLLERRRMSMGNWTYNGPNALVSYTVGIDFGQLSPATVRQVSALHPQFKRDLPRRSEQQAITFVMGGFPVAQSPTPQISGVVFDSLMPDGQTRAALSIGPNAVGYMVAEYTRWAEFWPVAERLLGAVAKVVMVEAPAQALILIANNRFEWSEPSGSIDIAALIRPNPQYVAPYVLRCKGPCHSFHGYQESQADPSGDRTDNVIFSAMTLPEGRTVADLNFNIRLALHRPIAKVDELLANGTSGGRSPLEVALWKLHELNKDLFRATICSEVGADMPGLLS